jgi:diaminopimelate epimerase
VHFVRARGLTTKREIRVQIVSGIIVPRLEDDGEVSVDMGAPILDPQQVPFATDQPGLVQALELDGRRLELAVLSMGNPHAVQVVADVDTAPVQTEGPRIERHARFPKRVNAGYMQLVDRHCVRLRVWERGAGETLACGTGACAAVVAGIARGLLDSPVRVEARGGALTVSWAGGDNPVWMKGPATTVFEGTMELAEQ